MVDLILNIKDFTFLVIYDFSANTCPYQVSPSLKLPSNHRRNQLDPIVVPDCPPGFTKQVQVEMLKTRFPHILIEMVPFSFLFQDVPKGMFPPVTVKGLSGSSEGGVEEPIGSASKTLVRP